MKAAHSKVSFQSYLTEEQIFDAFCELGETGTWRIGSSSDLLIKKEENSSELRFGQVDPDMNVQEIFDAIAQ